jgi:antitoxin (DNA-binding transcriptional repressor) of toxin-antitoxin stability system
MEKRVSKSQFKPRSLQFFRQIEETGEPLVITDRGRPVLKVVRYTSDPEEDIKALRNTVAKYERPTDPVGVEEWASLA